MQQSFTLLATGTAMPEPHHENLAFCEYAGATSAGDCYSHAFIWAATEADAVAAADCYRHMTRQGMSPSERMDRAIALWRGYGAEARHQLRRDSDACVEWLA